MFWLNLATPAYFHAIWEIPSVLFTCGASSVICMDILHVCSNRPNRFQSNNAPAKVLSAFCCSHSLFSCCRIRQEKNGGAWCPKAQISSEVREYLEVDLQKNHLMTWTETQGRFGNGQGQEYAEAFLVEYWRTALNQWVTYKDSRGEKVSNFLISFTHPRQTGDFRINLSIIHYQGKPQKLYTNIF